MEQLPKIVSDRLAAARVGNHPDADQLTAFAELSLPQKEGLQVLDHLSRCSDCRDVVMLALPESEAQTRAAYTPSTRLGWPVLRWAGLASCVVVVAAAVSLHHEWTKSYSPEGTNVESPNVVEQKPTSKANQQAADDETPQQSAKDAASGTQLPGIRGKESDLTVNAGPAASVVAQSNAPLQDGRDQDRLNQDQLNQDLRKSKLTSPAVPPVSGVAGKSMPATANANRNIQLAENQPALKSDGKREVAAAGVPVASPESVWDKVSISGRTSSDQQEKDQHKEGQQSEARKKSGLTPERLSSNLVPTEKSESEKERDSAKAAFPNARSEGSLQGASQEASSQQGVSAGARTPRWAVNSEGTLQKSVDDGKTWETVVLAGKANFRAVATSGLNIWVGGAAGVLYHSADGGQHWLEVRPVVDGEMLTGEITGVEFKDPMNGKLTTSGQKTWVTADGGQTWRKQ